METQQAISRARLAAKVGRELEVLIDHAEPGRVIGRSPADAPEIDGLVYVKGARKPQPGQLLKVKVTGSDDYDLEARVIPKREQQGVQQG
jgi:ribosomal protein S12 methylthiotransferase